MSEPGKALPRITEPDENLVHYVAPPVMGNATLCGLTDFIGHRKRGSATKAACTCRPCLGIVEFVNAAR